MKVVDHLRTSGDARAVLSSILLISGDRHQLLNCEQDYEHRVLTWLCALAPAYMSSVTYICMFDRTVSFTALTCWGYSLFKPQDNDNSLRARGDLKGNK